jgi:hypothetical protein
VEPDKKKEPKPPPRKEKVKPKPVVTKPPRRPDNPLLTYNSEEGVIRGQITWQGAVPTPAAGQERFVLVGGRKIPVKPAPRVIVDAKTGGVANAMIWLVRAPGNGTTVVPESVRVRQSRGQLRPHLQVAVRGSTLELGCSDDSADIKVTGKASFGATLTRGRRATVPLPRTGLVVVSNPEQAWMTPAYVRVLDHPYYAITGRDGRFQLPKVPPGDYEVILWHEGWTSGEAARMLPIRIEVKVKLGAGQGVGLQWTLPPA